MYFQLIDQCFLEDRIPHRYIHAVFHEGTNCCAMAKSAHVHSLFVADLNAPLRHPTAWWRNDGRYVFRQQYLLPTSTACDIYPKSLTLEICVAKSHRWSPQHDGHMQARLSLANLMAFLNADLGLLRSEGAYSGLGIISECDYLHSTFKKQRQFRQVTAGHAIINP